MEIINDNSCGWIDYQSRRLKINTLNQNLQCDFLIVGAGFTGLSAARKLSEIKDEEVSHIFLNIFENKR